MDDQPGPRHDQETVTALLVEFENVASRAAEVARSAARVIADGPSDEDAGTVYIVALEAVAHEVEATASRALRVMGAVGLTSP